jgi:hypothetical protein
VGDINKEREIRMRMRFGVGLALCVLSSLGVIGAQGVAPDPNLMREVAAVRAQLIASAVALRLYTWTEQTEVFVKGDVKSSIALTCRYDGSGSLTKTPVGEGKDKDTGRSTSNRPRQRKKADQQDYIERAVTKVHYYVPPKPDQIDYLLQHGLAALGRPEAGKAEIRFKDYYETGDSMVFTYDPVSKVLLRVTVASTLGSPQDPVTLEADFATLPDGVNHLASATLTAKKRNIQVKLRNVTYQRVTN